MKKNLFVLLGLLLLILPSSLTWAQADNAQWSQCLADVRGRMAQQQRIYRGILFGRPDAALQDTGSVRYDTEGNAWIKTKDSEWHSAAKGFDGTQWSDSQMNDQTEWEGLNETSNVTPITPRAGIFSQTGVLTSELIEPLLQSYRALRCRADMVCETLRATRAGEKPLSNGAFLLSQPGCQPLKAKPIQSCAFQNDPTDSPAVIGATDELLLQNECQSLGQELMGREAAILKLTVNYDAAYRSLMQFSGNFDRFLDEFRGDLFTPLQESMSYLGQLTRIPCFLSSCNYAD